MLEKKTIIGQVTVNESGHISVRTDTVILDDGVELSRSYHRSVLSPGDELPEPDAAVENHDRIAAVAGVVWTPKVIEEHTARVELAKAQLAELLSAATPTAAEKG